MLDEIPRIFEAVFECTLDVSTPPSTLPSASRIYTQMHLVWGDESNRNLSTLISCFFLLCFERLFHRTDLFPSFSGLSSEDSRGPRYPSFAFQIKPIPGVLCFATFRSSSDTISKKSFLGAHSLLSTKRTNSLQRWSRNLILLYVIFFSDDHEELRGLP
jgi:hypothetical protein